MDFSYEAYPAEMTQEEVAESISLELQDDYYEEPQHDLINFVQNMWLEAINSNTMVYYREDDEDGGDEDEDGGDDDEAGFVEDNGHVSESIKHGSDNITVTQEEVHATPALNDGYDEKKTKEETDNILDQITVEEKKIKGNDLDFNDDKDKTCKDDIEEFMYLLDKYEDYYFGLHHALTDTTSVEKYEDNDDDDDDLTGHNTISVEDKDEGVENSGEVTTPTMDTFDTISIEQDEDKIMNGRDTISVKEEDNEENGENTRTVIIMDTPDIINNKSARKKGRWSRFRRALRNLFSCHSPKTKDDYG